MFEAMFSALKRIFDNTLAPLLIATTMVALEHLLGALTFIIVIIVDTLLTILGAMLNWLPLPDLPSIHDVLPKTFFDIAHVVGFWPALLVYLGGAVVALIVKILTLGVVSR